MGFLTKLIKYISHVFIWGTWERQTPCLSHPPELRKGNLATSYSKNGKTRKCQNPSQSQKGNMHFQPHAFSLSSLARVKESGIFWQVLVGMEMKEKAPSWRLTFPKVNSSRYSKTHAIH